MGQHRDDNSGTTVFESTEDFAKHYIERHKKAIAPMTGDEDDRTVFARAKGTRIWDTDGREYLDYHASVGTSALGHGHPLIGEAQAKQQGVLDFVEGTSFYYSFPLEVGGRTYEISPAALAETLLGRMFPKDSGSTRCLFDLGGAGAVNIAAKLCFKRDPARRHFINFERAFHGRFGPALDLTASRPIQKQDYPSSGIVLHTLPYPMSKEDFDRALEMLNFIPLKNVNAAFMEPLQGEWGFRWPNQHYKDRLLAIQKREGILWADDEIQAGLGRTGKWFAYEHGDAKPDMVICGKPLGGGSVPISAVGYQRDMFGWKDGVVLQSGWHSGTFPLYPKSVASAIIFLDIMERERVVERAARAGELLTTVLNKYHTEEDRGVAPFTLRTGLGLMQGLEFHDFGGRADFLRRNLVLKRLKEANPLGIITVPAGIPNINPVIRFEPCLVVPDDEIRYLDTTLSAIL